MLPSPLSRPGRIRPLSTHAAARTAETVVRYIDAPPWGLDAPLAPRFIAPSPPPRSHLRSGSFTRSFVDASSGGITRFEDYSMERSILDCTKGARRVDHERRVWRRRWQSVELQNAASSPGTPPRPASAERRPHSAERRERTPQSAPARPASAGRLASDGRLAGDGRAHRPGLVAPARSAAGARRASPGRRPPGSAQAAQRRLAARSLAARVIQRRWRARARQRGAGARTSAFVATRASESFFRAAARIQSAHRAWHVRHRVAEAIEARARARARLRLRGEAHARELWRSLAAQRIQNRFRVARGEVRGEVIAVSERALLAENERFFARMREQLEDDTARTIQSYARGFIARCALGAFEREMRTRATVAIQARVRARLARAKVRTLALARAKGGGARRRSRREHERSAFPRAHAARASVDAADGVLVPQPPASRP
ncbi:hypothetical protein KFE25_009085 [Diacronema lutheri]|uniref:Uncharacterized protein n=1 Tax=Diacronema lutheri TaxID=2081491 RepID=A0A8J6CFF9_DIALT|nr:hypothetical protein KFE25_009085 [Diacronema lutheri]